MPLHDYPNAEQWAFGNSVEMADDLLGLVFEGSKTATCSDLSGYLEQNEPLPQVGQIDIVLDGKDQPRCAIRTISIDKIPFDKVSAEFAYAEGEGDRTLEHWRREHEAFFRQGSGFTGDMMLVCQRFEVVEVF